MLALSTLSILFLRGQCKAQCKSPSDIVSSLASTPLKPTLKPPHRRSTSLPILGDTWDLLSTDLSTLLTWNLRDECSRVHGEPLLIRLLRQPDLLVVSDPRAVEDVLKTHFSNFERLVYDAFFELTGDGLFGADGESWQLQRCVVAKLFTPTVLRGSSADEEAGVMQIIHKHVTTLHQLLWRQQRLEGEPHREAVDVSALLSDLTVEVVTEIGFGVPLGRLGAAPPAASDAPADDLHAFFRALDDTQSVLGRRFRLPPWLWKLQRALGVGLERSLRRHIARVDGVVSRLLDRSLAATRDGSSSRRRTLVTVFMDELDGDRQARPTLLRDLAVGFLVAGRDSTAQTLSWVLYCVARHPQVEARVLAELRRFWPARGLGEAPFLPTEAQLQQLVYLEAVVRETLRLYPVVAFNVRTCVADTQLYDGTAVRAGTRVGLPAFAMGRLPSLWGPDADAFRPDRWLERDGDALRVKHASAFRFPAFHACPRVCMGRHLAMLEIKTAAAALLASFRLELPAEGQEATYVASLTRPMKEPLRMRVDSRRSPADVQ